MLRRALVLLLAGAGLAVWLVWGPAGLTAQAASSSAHSSEAEKSAPEQRHSGHSSVPSGGHGSGEINPLDFQKDLALWTGAVFLVLLAILWRFAWGPIARGLEAREKRVADQIASAEQANREAQRLLEEYQKKLLASGEEVRQMLEAARRDAELARREIVEQARTDAKAERDRALREIDSATAAALRELAERSATLAVELAGKIISAKLDQREHYRLIEQAVARFAEQPPSTN